MRLLNASYRLDVDDVQPLPPDHPPRGLPNLVTSPHLAGARRQAVPQHCADPEVLGR